MPPCVPSALLFTVTALFPFPNASPGTRSLPSGVGPSDGQRASLLASELGCMSCHLPPQGWAPAEDWRPGPDLKNIGARRTRDALEAFLLNPSAHRPGTRMPELLTGSEREAKASDLAHYLASLGGPLALAEEGLHYEAVEAGRQLYHSVGCVACHVPFDEAWALERPLWSFEDALTPSGASGPLGFVAGESENPLGRSVPLGSMVGTRTRVELARFLEDPLATRPGGRIYS